MKPTLAVTSGSRDKTCRWWKVEEEIQLVFRGGGRTFHTGDGSGDQGESVVVADDAKERLGGGWFEGEEPDDGAVKLSAKDKKKGREFVEGSIDCVQHFVSGGDSGWVLVSILPKSIQDRHQE